MMTAPLLLWVLLLAALPADTSQPYLISAASMRVQMAGNDKITWLYGQVELVHGSTVIRGDSAWVSTLLQKATIWDHVSLQDRSAVITGQRADYYKLPGRAVVFGKPRAEDRDWRLTSDSMAYLKPVAKSYAYGHVTMTDSSGRDRISGDYGEYWHSNGYGFITGHPRLEILPADSAQKSTTVLADTMETLQFGATAVAFGNVSLNQDSLWAGCGRLTYFRKEGRFVMEDNPRLWQADQDLRAKTIGMAFSSDTIRSFWARDSVVLRQYAAERPDTEIITSDSLWAEFTERKLSKALAIGNAWSRYHMNQKEKQASKNLAAGEEMQFYFTGGKIERIIIDRRARGAYLEREQP